MTNAVKTILVAVIATLAVLFFFNQDDSLEGQLDEAASDTQRALEDATD